MTDARLGYYCLWSVANSRWVYITQTSDARYACAAASGAGPGIMPDQWEQVGDGEEGMYDVYLPGQAIFERLKEARPGTSVAELVAEVEGEQIGSVMVRHGRYAMLEGAEEVFRAVMEPFVDDGGPPRVGMEVVYRDAAVHDIAPPVYHEWWTDAGDPRDGISVSGAGEGQGVEAINFDDDEGQRVLDASDYEDPSKEDPDVGIGTSVDTGDEELG